MKCQVPIQCKCAHVETEGQTAIDFWALSKERKEKRRRPKITALERRDERLA